MNALLLKAWLAEYASDLAGTRLREVRQVDKKNIALHLVAADRTERWLLISILETYPVVVVGDDSMLSTEVETTSSGFVKALRFHLAGATLTGITQEGFDRSVCFGFSRQDIYGRETQRTLRVELVGRASNAYLLSEKNMVISMFKQVPAGRNSVRRVVTGKPLPPPPPLGKFLAEESSVESLQQELDNAGSEPLKEVLTRRVAGGDVWLWPRLEPLVDQSWNVGNVFAFIDMLQAGKLNENLFPEANALALQEWQSRRASDGRQSGDVAASLPDYRLVQLQSQLELAKRAEELEQLGLEMLQRVPSLHTRNAEAAYVRGWQLAHPDWSARVEITKPVEENAGSLIEYAQRLKRARPRLAELVSSASAAGSTPAAESSRVTDQPRSGPAARSPDPIQRDLSKLERAGVKYLRYVTSDSIPLLVGQSDRSNDELVRHYGSSRHLWLHVRDYPGSHVLLLTNGREVPQRSLEEAAVVAGYYSQGRGETELEVSYTPVKQLRRPRGGKPGQVLKLSEKVIRVNPLLFESLREQLRR